MRWIGHRLSALQIQVLLMERFQNTAEWTADSMNLSLFCGDLSKLLTRNSWKTPPFFWFRDGWFSTREVDPNVVVDLPEELEISSLGNLASSSRRFNLQLQAQEAWRQVWGDFPRWKSWGKAKSYWGGWEWGSFHAWDFLAPPKTEIDLKMYILEKLHPQFLILTKKEAKKFLV